MEFEACLSHGFTVEVIDLHAKMLIRFLLIEISEENTVP